MNKPETPRSVFKLTLIVAATTAIVVVIVQVAARLITGKTLGGLAVAIGVPVALGVVWTVWFLRRKSG